MRYEIEYELDGERKIEEIADCSNPGAAFAACVKLHPKARMIRATAHGRSTQGGFEGYTDYEPPPVQRPPQKRHRLARALRPNEKGCEFPWYDEVKNKG